MDKYGKLNSSNMILVYISIIDGTSDTNKAATMVSLDSPWFPIVFLTK